MRIAIRADELVAFYSEDEAGQISVRNTDKRGGLRVWRDGNGRVGGVVPSS